MVVILILHKNGPLFGWGSYCNAFMSYGFFNGWRWMQLCGGSYYELLLQTILCVFCFSFGKIKVYCLYLRRCLLGNKNNIKPNPNIHIHIKIASFSFKKVSSQRHTYRHKTRRPTMYTLICEQMKIKNSNQNT